MDRAQAKGRKNQSPYVIWKPTNRTASACCRNPILCILGESPAGNRLAISRLYVALKPVSALAARLYLAKEKQPHVENFHMEISRLQKFRL
ncbi:hypothetical protein [Parvibaculum sp.]|jgi:hypothetical protein|uniref:hypothetical protein n=1 Tax=Parvibaculum sp. TaxID=2024848 RepID=UPI00391CFB67